MTSPKQILSAHFNALRSQSLEAIDSLGKYLARFAKVYPNPSHRTKQMKDVANELYQQRLNSVENIRNLLKQMQGDVVLFGFSESTVSYVELTKARKSLMEHCVKLRVEWDRHNTNAWTEADKQQMILFASSNAAETAAVVDALHDAVVTFRIAITAHLDSAPFRTLASNMNEEQSKKLSQIADSNAAYAAALAAAAALKKRAREEEEGQTTDLRQPKSKRSKQDADDNDDADEDSNEEDDDESDDLIVVPDDEKIVREPKTILDDGSESFGDDESSSSEIQAVVEKRNLRGGEKRAEIVKNIQSSEKILRKLIRTKTIVSDEENADAADEKFEDDEADADIEDNDDDESDNADDTESFEPQPRKQRNLAAAYIDDEAEGGDEEDDEDGDEDDDEDKYEEVEEDDADEDADEQEANEDEGKADNHEAAEADEDSQE